MAGQRPLVRLRPLRAAGVDQLAAWLPDVAIAAGCDQWTSADELRTATGNRTVLTAGSDYNCFLAYELGSPYAGAALVRLLAVAPDARRVGLGGRVALALEKRLAASTKQIYVDVRSRIGIALYFWLRLGYRPLLRYDTPDSTPALAVRLVRDIG